MAQTFGRVDARKAEYVQRRSTFSRTFWQILACEHLEILEIRASVRDSINQKFDHTKWFGGISPNCD
jgi:hypothetical protein